MGEEAFDALVQSLRSTTSLQVISTPQDVASAIVWLVEGARMMTGETITLDGGQHLGGGGGTKQRQN